MSDKRGETQYLIVSRTACEALREKVDAIFREAGDQAQRFEQWCDEKGLERDSAATIDAFLADEGRQRTLAMC
jgi:hypothetical protein